MSHLKSIGLVRNEIQSAVSNGDVAQISSILIAGSPMISDVLNEACRVGQLSVIQWLADKCKGLLSNRCFSVSACLITAENGHLNVLQWLAANGALVNSDTLLRACTYGQLEIVKWLLDNGVPVGPSNWAMEYAAANGHLSTVEVLAVKVGDLTLHWDRIAYIAARHGRLNVLQWAHKNGADILGYSFLSAAANKGHLHVLRWLHDQGANVHAEGLLIRAAEEGHFDVVEWLVQQGVNATVYGNTAIVQAVRANNMPMMRWLIQHGADVSMDDNQVMRIAVVRMHWDIVKYLVEECGVNVTCNDNFAMACASGHGDLEMVAWLRERGAGLPSGESIPYHASVQIIAMYESLKAEEQTDGRILRNSNQPHASLPTDIASIASSPCDDRFLEDSSGDAMQIVD